MTNKDTASEQSELQRYLDWYKNAQTSAEVRNAKACIESLIKRDATTMQAAPEAPAIEKYRKVVEDWATKAGWDGDNEGEGAFEYARRISYELGQQDATPAATTASASIDTPEFAKLVVNYRMADSTEPELDRAYEALIAHIDARRAAVSTTGDAWISVKDRLPECDKKAGSFGVEVIVYPKPEKGESTAFYGRRISQEPDFYKYGSRVGGITHWMYLPAAPQSPTEEA